MKVWLTENLDELTLLDETNTEFMRDYNGELQIMFWDDPEIWVYPEGTWHKSEKKALKAVEHLYEDRVDELMTELLVLIEDTEVVFDYPTVE